jgi:putative Mn2+ efflux pump MntP
MGLAELFVIAVGLSMDAFAVSVCKGLSVQKLKVSHALTCGVYFGGFQGLMPLIGYLLGSQFEEAIVSIDHWVAFILLGIIGFNMIKESREEESEADASFGFKAMLVLAIATSIDALAVGISFTCIGYTSATQLAYPSAAIGLVSSLMSAAGLHLGVKFGKRFAGKVRAELLGGIILIIIGIKIFIEHMCA